MIIASKNRNEVTPQAKPLDVILTFTNTYGDTWHELIPYARLRAMVASVKSPLFMHGRARSSLCGYPSVLVYHRDRTSPSGRILGGAGPSVIIDRLIRDYHKTSALSPTEHLCAPSRAVW